MNRLPPEMADRLVRWAEMRLPGQKVAEANQPDDADREVRCFDKSGQPIPCENRPILPDA